MRQNAMERDAADADGDNKLDFAEFCNFVRDREAGEFTEEELANMMRKVGMRAVSYTNLTFGTVAIHSGFRLPGPPLPP